MNQYADAIDAAQDGWSAPHPLSIADLTADTVIDGREVRLCGWSVRETAGAAAKWRLWDSTTVGQGQIVGNGYLAANLSDTQWLGDKGVLCVGGLTVDVLAGAMEFVVWVRHAVG